MIMTGYDIIGDIHGHADALRRLLEKMNYAYSQGVYHHSSRKAVFVGDFIDRGPQQIEVLSIVQGMCAGGHAFAVMGNHEFNALAWSMPDGKGGHLRSHSPEHLNQHEAFLSQLGEGSSAYHEALAWFWRLPVWLDLGDIRVVHACWHGPSQKELATILDDHQCFMMEHFRSACDRSSPAYIAVEVLLKGPEAALPAGMSFHDKEGHRRTDVRLRWWDEQAKTFRSAAMGMEGEEHNLPDHDIPHDYAYADSIPVFFGHYWLTGRPNLRSTHAACLDFSVARNGLLAAYRWSGETELRAENFVAVAPQKDVQAQVLPRIASRVR